MDLNRKKYLKYTYHVLSKLPTYIPNLFLNDMVIILDITPDICAVKDNVMPFT